MSRPALFCTPVILLTTVVLLLGCGHGKSVVQGSSIGLCGSGHLQQTVNVIPTVLPIDHPQPWESLGNGARDVSAINHESSVIPGIEWHDVHGAYQPKGEAVQISSGNVGDKDINYVLYRIPMDGNALGSISVDVNLAPRNDGSPSVYYVGLSDYARDAWEWYGPFTYGHIRLNAGDGDYLTNLGNTYINVMAFDGSVVDVVAIGVNPKNLADTTPPPVPEAPQLTPFDGGAIINWIPVISGDLAGYKVRVYQGSDPEQPGAMLFDMNHLTGDTQYIINGVSGDVLVRLFASDIGGNVSEGSAMSTATIPTGDELSLQTSVTPVSGLLGFEATITAQGADRYNFDLDGDGDYDITNSSGNSVQADTGHVGLVRPRIMGIDGARRAYSTVSLYVNYGTRPVAVAKAGPATGTAPLTVFFNGTDSMDSDGNLVGGGWDFNGDGTYDAWSDSDLSIANGSSHIYTEAGVYNARLRVIDNDGLWDIDTVTIVVNGTGGGPGDNDDPVAVLGVAPEYARVGSLVTLDGSGSTDTDGSVVKYEWDFNGDGVFDSYGEVSTAQHNYNNPGVFIALLRVTDNDGGQDVAAATVRINPMNNGPSEWWMFGGMESHSRLSSLNGPSSNNNPWTFDKASDFYSSPTIAADGTIYIGCFDSRLYAISPLDGSEIWSFNTGWPVFSTPAIGSDGTVYVGGNDNKLYAVNPSDGTEKWSYTTSAPLYSSPAVGPDGTVYIGNTGGFLYAINPNGTLKWSYETLDQIYTSPAIAADGTVYIGSYDDYLYAVNPDGSQKWAYNAGSDVYSSAAIGPDGTIYVGSSDTNLHAINPGSGTRIWTYSTGDDIDSSPAIGPDGTIYVGSNDNSLHAVNPDGSQKWTYPMGDDVRSSPAVGADGIVYVGCNDNHLYAINPDGSLKWSLVTGDIVFSSPAIGSGNALYFGCHDDKMYYVGP